MKSFLPLQTRTNRTVSHTPASHQITQPVRDQDEQRESNPDIPTQLARAARFGHSISRIPIFPPAPDTTHTSKSDSSSTRNMKNNTSLPHPLKARIEHLSGLSLDGVRVDYNSSKPAQVQALAYTQGTQIHLGPGQEKYLPHEAWHVVQQMQGRVKPTLQEMGVAMNDDSGLEREADVMGAKGNTAQHQNPQDARPALTLNIQQLSHHSNKTAIQRVKGNKPAKPGDAGRYALVYKSRGTWHCREGNKHWVYSTVTNSWRKLRSSPVALHNRVNFAPQLGKGAPRRASYKSRVGSGASYSDRRQIRYTVGVSGEVTYQTSKRRTYRKIMQAATGYASATAYAGANNAPVIAGGYNWCHLIGHGGGGSDNATNLVAASTHANSEHLLIERILYTYKGKGISIDHHFAPFNGLQIAKAMRYRVIYAGKVIFEREVDGFRTNKPSGVELAAVEVQLTKAITDALDESNQEEAEMDESDE